MTNASATWPDATADPGGEAVLRHLAGNDLEHRHDAIGAVGLEIVSIENEEQFGGDQGDALVAVDKWVVAGDPPAAGGSQFRGIRTSAPNSPSDDRTIITFC
jgi:hypothetical protein